MSVTSPVTGRVTGIVASGVTRAVGRRRRATAVGPITRIAENGDTRISENGDTRVQEESE